VLQEVFEERAQHALNSSPIGMAIKVTRMSGCSFLDLLSDVYMIVEYLTDDDTVDYGYILLGMVVTSVVIQMAVVIVQYFATPRKMLLELVAVILGVKPVVNAFRVCAGHAQGEHHPLDRRTEYSSSKVVEIFAESIPGCILQMYVVFKGLENGTTPSYAAIASLVVSALTTGLTSKNISFNFDTDSIKRSETPGFYGYIPSSRRKRSAMQKLMVMNSAILLLLRSSSAALLMLVNKSYYVIYIVGDIALNLVYKAVRRDFTYWIPLEGVMGFVFSLFIRIVIKVVTDHTGILQFRASPDLGGLYWSVSMLLAMSVSAVSVLIYYDDSRDVEAMAERTAWMLCGGLSGLWVVTFGCILWLMKKEYRKTFWSTESGNDYSMQVSRVLSEARAQRERRFIANAQFSYRKANACPYR